MWGDCLLPRRLRDARRAERRRLRLAICMQNTPQSCRYGAQRNNENNENNEHTETNENNKHNANKENSENNAETHGALNGDVHGVLL